MFTDIFLPEFLVIAFLIILLPILQKRVQIINCCPLIHVNHHMPTSYSGKFSVVTLACLKTEHRQPWELGEGLVVVTFLFSFVLLVSKPPLMHLSPQCLLKKLTHINVL